MKKNTATKIVFPILDADGDPVTGAAALDSEYSLDGAGFGDCASEATEIGTSGIYYLNLAQGETNGDVVCIQVKTSTAGAKTTVLVFYTSAQTLDEIDTNVDSILTDTNELQTDWANGGRLDLLVDAILADTGELQTDWVNGGRLDLLIDAVKAATDNLPADPADDSDIDAQLATIAGYIDTEVAAIKAVTDTLSLGAIADAVHDEVTEGTTTLRHAIKLICSALFAKTSGGGTNTLVARDIGDTKPRITLTTDANGNRTASTLDGT